MSSFTLSTETATALELPELLALVRLHAATDLGRDRIDALAPCTDEVEWRGRRELFEEATDLVPLVPSMERAFGPILRALGSNQGQVDGEDVVAIADLLRATHDVGRRLAELEPPPPRLTERVAGPDFGELLRRIDRIFDGRGKIRPDASPRLIQLRERARGARDRLYRDLGGLLENQRDLFGEDTIPMRGGRLVVMLKSGAKGRIPGLVHGRSGTGKSFYFEPLESVDANNDLSEALEEEEAEKRRLLAEVLRELRGRLDDLMVHADLVAHLDEIQAIVRFGQLLEARPAELAPPGEMRLVGARHPLLDPRLAESRREALGQPGHQGEVIPLDLELGQEARLLTVTGPNAGGKTVALKTLGLLALAHQCGLPIPAEEGSRLPVLRGVVATVGDEQDLLEDRSTFSGRLLRLAEAWEAAGPGVLVLLDELGSGTDPSEGAALSISLIEELIRRGGPTLVTTHLVAVAAAAMEHEAATCAAMAFDTASGQPTYRLTPGPPGGSEALALGRRLGLPVAWLERADTLLGPEHRDLRRLLSEVESLRSDLVTRQAELEIETRDAETLRQRLAEDHAALAEERRHLEDRLRDDLRSFRHEVQARFRDEAERLRKQIEAGRRRGLEAEATERLFTDAPLSAAPAAPTPDRPLQEGDRVRHRLLGWSGILRRLDRKRAEVDVHGKSFSCKLDELLLKGTAEPTREPKRSRREIAKGLPVDSRPEDETISRNLELIGQRVEPALASLDRHLDQALLESFDQVRVVHGHGTGRLRRAIREHLRSHPAVASHRPGNKNEGGDGATIVVLRG